MTETIEKRLGSINEACERYSMGRTSLIAYAKEIGAFREFSKKMKRIDFKVMDDAIDNLGQEEGEIIWQ